MTDLIRQIPEGEDLEALLNGATGKVETTKPPIPPMPSRIRDDDREGLSGIIEKELVKEEPSYDEGPNENFKKQMILPTDREKAILKEKYGPVLRVVPLPYLREDGKVQTYVLRPLSRAQWKKHLEIAEKIVEGKPGLNLNIEEVFQEKVVSFCVVWPAIDDTALSGERAGLIPTLFGVVQQISLFIAPEVVAQLSFNL